MKIELNVDAYGGDNSPKEVLEGTELFLEKNLNKDIGINLFVTEDFSTNLINKLSNLKTKSKVLHSSLAIDNNTKLKDVLKKDTRDNTLANSIKFLTKGIGQAAVSSGNTGAMMAYSKLFLKSLPEISRPAIASLFPSKNHPVCMLDLGANSECDAKNLLDFAKMGSVYYKALFPNSDCKVSLLNIGTEDIKGNSVIQSAHEMLLSVKDINYQGFIEGNQITNTNSHIIVSDGFTGNVALKTAEGVASFITNELKKNLTNNLFSKFASLLLKKNLLNFKKSIDPRSFNGGIFLGVKGVVIKSHGNSDRFAFCNALDFSLKCIEYNLIKKIESSKE